MVLGPKYGEQEAEEKHHQAEADEADDCKETHAVRHIALLFKSALNANFANRNTDVYE